jgi:DnaJ-class molecular chaperone
VKHTISYYDTEYQCPMCRKPTRVTTEETGARRIWTRQCISHESICGWEGFERSEVLCGRCGGDGYVEHADENPCSKCDGEGWVPEESDI